VHAKSPRKLSFFCFEKSLRVISMATIMVSHRSINFENKIDFYSRLQVQENKP
jgi:hypothetical protein